MIIVPQPLKPTAVTTINIYTDKVLQPALQYNYISFLLPTINHSNELFLLLQRHAKIRIMVKRKVIATTTVYEDDVEYEYEQPTQSVTATLYGITDFTIPNPTKTILNALTKYSGYETTDEWIGDFCKSLSRNTARKLSYLCLHYGNAKKWGNRKTTSAYVITVLVEKIKK